MKVIKLRRGLESERTSIIPKDGEPLWTTDSKELWIGDGVTAGGIKVTGTNINSFTDLLDTPSNYTNQAGAFLKVNQTSDGVQFSVINISDLDDVNLNNAQNGDVLKYNTSLQLWEPKQDNNIIQKLDDIVDVTVGAAQDGMTLVWNDTNQKWVPGIVQGAETLNNLTDVDTSGVVINQVLKFDGTNWVPGNIDTIQDINDIPNVDTTNAQVGQSLNWDGTNWVPGNTDGGLF